ncbi:MAG: hypothetical protein V4651_00865 [Bacteroidota bacterium]
MKRSVQYKIIVWLLAVTIVAACKKDKQVVPLTQAQADVLMSLGIFSGIDSSYKIIGRLDGSGNVVYDTIIEVVEKDIQVKSVQANDTSIELSGYVLTRIAPHHFNYFFFSNSGSYKSDAVFQLDSLYLTRRSHVMIYGTTIFERFTGKRKK